MATAGASVLFLTLEFARKEQSGDPYAFHLGRLQYLVRKESGSFETAELNWDGALLADLAAVRKPGADPAMVQRIGETLRQFLQPAGWLEYELQIQQAVKERRRVVLTLCSAAAELYALPWEFMTLKGSGQHIAELPDLLVRYEWPATSTATEQNSFASPGRILLAWSAAAGSVPAAEHVAAIQQASRSSADSFDPSRDVLAHVSVGKLDQVLAQAQKEGSPISVLHLLCHGSSAGQTFGLAMRGEDPSEVAIIDAGRLRQVLAPYAGMVRLVVLAACDSGNSGELGNQLGSIAQTLHRAGFASVVASRFPLSVAGSIRMTQALYLELCSESGSLEQAFLSARHQLALNAEQLDWASLQLYAHSSSPVFERPSFLHRPESLPATDHGVPGGAALVSPAQPVANADGPPETIKLAVSRSKLVMGLSILGVALLAVFLGSALWPEPDEGPIVLQNGKCLSLDQQDFENQRDGGEVIQWVCHGGASQNWHRNGRRIVNANGLCLEVSMPDYLAKKDGGRIQVGVCNPKMDNQQWQDNKKELRTYNNKCLAIEIHDFQSGKQGGLAQQWECTGKPNQWFTDGHRSQ